MKTTVNRTEHAPKECREAIKRAFFTFMEQNGGAGVGCELNGDNASFIAMDAPADGEYQRFIMASDYARTITPANIEQKMREDLDIMEAYLTYPRMTKEQYERVENAFADFNDEEEEKENSDYPPRPLSVFCCSGFFGENGSFNESYDEATLICAEISIYGTHGADTSILIDLLKEIGLSVPASFEYTGDGDGKMLFGFDFIPVH